MEESYLREHSKVIDYLQCAAQHLKLTIQPTTIACMLYHRVVEKQSQLQSQEQRVDEDCHIEKHLIGASCLYLASKIAEEPTRIRDVVNVCYRLLHPDKEMLEIAETYWNLRDSVTACELMVLRYLKFQVLFETPVKYLLFFLTSLQDWNHEEKKWNEKRIVQSCWNIVNDACYLPAVVTESPALIATAIIYTVFQLNAIDVAENKEGKKWFQIFVPESSEQQIQGVGIKIMAVYVYNGKKSIES